MSGIGTLTPQQQQAIQQAVSGDVTSGNGSWGTLDQNIINQLQSSGLFSPAQLQTALTGAQNAGTGNYQNQGGGNTSGMDASLAANIAAGINDAPSNQTAITSQFAPSTTSPNAQATAAGYNPLQPAYLPQPATLSPTTVQPSYLSQPLLNSLGPQQTIGALQNSVAPQYQQQDQQMMQMLATAGLAPSSTAGQTAFNNLAQQQLAGISPAMASAIQNSQGNQLNAGQFNATTGNTGATYNAGVMNSAAAQNLQNQLQQQQYNANAYTGAGNTYFNAETGAYNNNANAFNALNTAGVAGAQNLASGQQQGGTTLASGAQNEFPIYGGGSNPYGAFASAGTYPQPTGGTYSASPISGGQQYGSGFGSEPIYDTAGAGATSAYGF